MGLLLLGAAGYCAGFPAGGNPGPDPDAPQANGDSNMIEPSTDVRARRLPPGYRFWVTDSDAVSPPESPRIVIRLVADDGTPVLSGSVITVGEHDAVQVVDYTLQQEIGDVIHADTHSMVNAAWTHYKLRVSWWHRIVTHYATTWAVMVALLLGIVSIVIALTPTTP